MSVTPPQDNDIRITVRSIILGLITAGGVTHVAILSSDGFVGGFVRSQFPMTVLMPFALWLLANILLKVVWPKISLRQGELLTILCMTWVVGTIPNQGWMNYAVPLLAAPTFYATKVNLWSDSIFDYLPWHVFAKTSANVIDLFWLGGGKEVQVPWEGWLLPAAHWLGACPSNGALRGERRGQRRCEIQMVNFEKFHAAKRHQARLPGEPNPALGS